MRTGGKILTDLAQNTNSDVTPSVIVSKHLSESTENLIGKILNGEDVNERETPTQREPIQRRRRRRKPNRQMKE